MSQKDRKSGLRGCSGDTAGHLPNQGCSRYTVWLNRIVRYIRTAALLHMVSAAGVMLFIWFGRLFYEMAEQSGITVSALLCLFLSVYGGSLVCFSQLDAFSRFQNYKQVKDLLYEKGLEKRVIRLFSLSRCQRDAVGVAARDLGMAEELAAFYRKEGYRWFHFFPDVTFKQPGIFFSKPYWQKTLFTPKYDRRYFLW